MILSGVSNWGAYALLAAASLLRPDWRPARYRVQSIAEHREALRILSEARLAVDGLTRTYSVSVDGLEWEVYSSVLNGIAALLGS